eukprot:TRINITY_DN5374_c0_g1_i2.p2 TRINITY_DN5374_c0_g1~~TRINITY_DN5374_c0_g1_i2.p2  ORF type:complete len:111 (+),score=4.67 TRINITY_DN5374_c0_g1_i2:220-552(+)
MRESSEQEAKRLSCVGCHRTQLTSFSCPVSDLAINSVFTSFPSLEIVIFEIEMTLSSPPETIKSAGLQSTERIGRVCSPFRVVTTAHFEPVSVATSSQIRIVSSCEQETK